MDWGVGIGLLDEERMGHALMALTDAYLDPDEVG